MNKTMKDIEISKVLPPYIFNTLYIAMTGNKAQKQRNAEYESNIHETNHDKKIYRDSILLSSASVIILSKFIFEYS